MKNAAKHRGSKLPRWVAGPLYWLVKCCAEIRKVGIRDWLWFVVYLKRNEFSHKLGIDYMSNKYVNDLPFGPKFDWCRFSQEVIDARDRAHRIDMELST